MHEWPMNGAWRVFDIEKYINVPNLGIKYIWKWEIFEGVINGHKTFWEWKYINKQWK
jgi:hypothetical protein